MMNSSNLDQNPLFVEPNIVLTKLISVHLIVSFKEGQVNKKIQSCLLHNQVIKYTKFGLP